MAYHLKWQTGFKNHSSYEDKSRRPKNWTIIDEKEFIKTLVDRPPEFMYRTYIQKDSDGKSLPTKERADVMLFFFDWENQQGIAITRIKYFARKRGKQKKRERIEETGFAKFAICFHKWRELNAKEAKSLLDLDHTGMWDHIWYCDVCEQFKRHCSSG